MTLQSLSLLSRTLDIVYGSLYIGCVKEALHWSRTWIPGLIAIGLPERSTCPGETVQYEERRP